MDDGMVHVREISPTPWVAAKPVGTPGVVAVEALAVSEAVPAPAALTAEIRNV